MYTLILSCWFSTNQERSIKDTQYFGGKFRIRKELSQVLKYYKTDKYLEPFCGSCWVGELMPQQVKVFSDYNYYLIEMWKKVQKGWIPPKDVSEKQYKLVRDRDDVPAYLKGFVGFASSWGGKFWGGYARGIQSNRKPRNYTANASNQLTKRIKNMTNVKFVHSKYSLLFSSLLNSKSTWLVYCDPPYEGTTQFYGLPNFNHDVFWNNVRAISKKHYVLTSSYNAPNDFECVYEINTKTDIQVSEWKSERIEKLFAIGKAIAEL